MMRSDTCYLHLLRHGATVSNLMRPPRLQGQHVDLELSDEGRAQAERTAQALAERPIAAIYSSPMQRAQQTAEAVAALHRLSVQTVEELVEVDVGHWENLQWNEIEQSDAENYRRFMEDPVRFGYPGGESLEQVVARVTPAFERLAQQHLGEEIVVVAHRVVNRTYLGYLLGLADFGASTVPQDNCAINLLRARGERLKPVTINSVLHLELP